jgi:hypothetical protein
MFGPPPFAYRPQALVALTYRRVDRALKGQGASPPEHHHGAYEAAMAAYLRLDPDAPTDRLEASGIVSTMIANAIRADTTWFWHGPDDLGAVSLATPSRCTI